MQSNIILFIIISNVALATIIGCAPTDHLEPETELEVSSLQTSSLNADSFLNSHDVSTSVERKKIDYYVYRHTVADGVQKALDECRDKFKWDRWNCPKKAFLDILGKNPLPSNKELGLTRALIASGVVLSLTKSCSYGTNNVCGCSQPTLIEDEHPLMRAESNSKSDFMWNGCLESIKFAFKVSKIYLESQDVQQDDSSRIINSHNYEVGRQAVKNNMKVVCKCHGVSGNCGIKTCWPTVPDMNKVGDYLKRQYRSAAKVGAVSAEETNSVSLKEELSKINHGKLVFADASPDYCYENPKLGINGTLGRYCSKAKHRADGTPVDLGEKDSCDRLCTKCGYKIKREQLNTVKNCDCRFVYCCKVECKRCPHVEEAYRCVRHS